MAGFKRYGSSARRLQYDCLFSLASQADEASQELGDQNDSANATSSGVGDGGEGKGGEGDEGGGYYFVRTFAWTPQFGQQEVVLDVCSNSPAGVCTRR